METALGSFLVERLNKQYHQQQSSFIRVNFFPLLSLRVTIHIGNGNDRHSMYVYQKTSFFSAQRSIYLHLHYDPEVQAVNIIPVNKFWVKSVEHCLHKSVVPPATVALCIQFHGKASVILKHQL